MTSSHAAKDAIRERMARTGETYSTARKNLQKGDQPADKPRQAVKVFPPREVCLVIEKGIRARQGILVAGRTGSGKHATLSYIVTESGPEYPRFILSGEITTRTADGSASPMVKAGALLLSIAESGIPIAAEIQAETEEAAYERFSKTSGLTLEAVKNLFPVVAVIPSPVVTQELDSSLWNKALPGDVGGGMGFKLVLDPTGAPGFPPFPAPVSPEDLVELSPHAATPERVDAARQGRKVVVLDPSAPPEDKARAIATFQGSVRRSRKT